MKVEVSKLSDVELYELIKAAEDEKHRRRLLEVEGKTETFEKNGILYIPEYTYDIDQLKPSLKNRLIAAQVRRDAENAIIKTVTEQAPKTKLKCWKSKITKKEK